MWNEEKPWTNFILHGHTEKSLLYKLLIDKLVGYWRVVVPNTGMLLLYQAI